MMSNFNFNFQPGMSSEQMVGFEMAGRIWSQYIDDDAVFNVGVATTDLLPDSVIGGAIPAYVATDIATVQKALSQDATSSDDAIAISNLNTTTASNGETQYRALLKGSQYQSSEMTITQANAKALGIESFATPNSADGYVLFNTLDDSGYSWDYDFARTSTDSNQQQLDFLGMALHELGHVMGFVSGIDSMDEATTQSDQQSTSQFSLLGLGSPLLGSGNRDNTANQVDLSQTSVFDLFRYSDRSANRSAKEFTQGEEAYFSIDGGQTSIAPLSTGLVENSDGTNDYQASHWGYEAPQRSTSRGRLGLSSLFGLVTNPLGSVFQLADAALSLPGALLGSQFSTVSKNASQRSKSLGIMDPVLVPGKQSSISSLDLQALDVIGYDLIDASSLELDYGELLRISEQQVAIRGNFEEFEDFEAFEEEILERRRSRVRTRRSVFFQDVEGQPPVEQNLSSQRLAISSPMTGTVLNSVTPSASSNLLDTATDESVSGQDIEIDDLLVDGSNRQRSGKTVQTFGGQTPGPLSSSNDDFTSIESPPLRATWPVLFGVSDSYVSGRSGTGSWLFNQSPSPLLLNLKGASSLTNWR